MAFELYSKKLWQICLSVLILIGAAGSVIFFPLKLSESHTCVYHKIICPEDTCYQKGSVLSTETSKDMHHQVMDNISLQHHSELINRYLMPFGLLWWGSLILLFSGIYLFKNLYR